MSMELAVLVAALGAVGAVIRYALLSIADNPRASIAVLAGVNLSGSALAGVVIAADPSLLTTAALVGLCGGLTTFSTLALQLAPAGSPRPPAQILGLGSLHAAGSALAAWAGYSGAIALGFAGWG